MPGAMPTPRSPSPPPPVVADVAEPEEDDGPPSPSVFGAYRDISVAIPLTEPAPSVFRIEGVTPPRRSRRSSGHQPPPTPELPPTPLNPETDVHRRLTPRKSALKLTPSSDDASTPEEEISEPRPPTPQLKRKRSSVSFNAEIQLLAIPHRVRRSLVVPALTRTERIGRRGAVAGQAAATGQHDRARDRSRRRRPALRLARRLPSRLACP